MAGSSRLDLTSWHQWLHLLLPVGCMFSAIIMWILNEHFLGFSPQAPQPEMCVGCDVSSSATADGPGPQLRNPQAPQIA
jgi:hypothetical protein